MAYNALFHDSFDGYSVIGDLTRNGWQVTTGVGEDPSISVAHDQDMGQMILWGQGEMHLRVALERLIRKYGAAASTYPREVPYKESIRKQAQVRGRHKKQSGGHGQFGDVVLDIKPLPRGSGFTFAETITGGVVPKNYIPSVEHGVRDYLNTGPLGFQVVDVAVCLVDGGSMLGCGCEGGVVGIPCLRDLAAVGAVELPDRLVVQRIAVTFSSLFKLCSSFG